MIFILHRTQELTDRTLGILFVVSHNRLLNTFNTLELPWRNNQRNISCIPTGEYDVTPRHSARFGNHLHVLDVPNRSFILFHVGNWPRNTEGCILPGLGLVDIDNDGIPEVVSSRIAMNRLVEYGKNGCKLKII